MEQAIRDMGNYGVKLRKPEELPDFDQPVDYEEEKKRFEPVQLEELEEMENHDDFSKHHIKIQDCPQREGLFLPKKLTSEWEKPSAESN